MSLSFDTAEAGSLLTYDCHRAVPAPFLTKTYHLVDDPATNDIVSWGEDQTTFVVWRPPEFARDLLPNYFKHNNFSSFVRQLNTYGFRKIVPDRWEFANEFFRRGEKQLLCEIHRRKTSQPTSGNASQPSRSHSPSNSGEDQGWSPFSSPLSSPRTTIIPNTATVLMSDENERLRRDNSLLLSELSRIRRLYDDVVVILQQQSKTSFQDAGSLSSRIKGTSCSLGVPIVEGLSAKLGDSVADQLEAAARREEIRELSLQVKTRKDSNSGAIPLLESSYAGLLALQPQSIAHRDSATPKASTLSFLDGKLREMASNASRASVMDEVKSPPKLFGVHLHGKELRQPGSWDNLDLSRKRLRSDSWDVLEQPVNPRNESNIARLPPSKCVKTELALELIPTSAEAPWLRICAARDERVYI